MSKLLQVLPSYTRGQASTGFLVAEYDMISLCLSKIFYRISIQCGPFLKTIASLHQSFLSVVVITCASHAQGRRFEPGRKQTVFLISYYFIKCLDQQ